MTYSEKIKEFVRKFFENLGCEIEEMPSDSFSDEKTNSLKVQNVPPKFAKFYGKTEPYYFYFDESEKIPEGEYITKGSYLLSCINKFLEDKGETTLLKIRFDEKPRELIEKRFTIRNCEISEVSFTNHYEYLERFTFLTTFQYLNKKEEVVNRIFMKNSREIEFDLDRFQVEEGKKRDLKTTDFQNDYSVAKEKLQEKIQEKKDSLKEYLSEALEKEKQRVENHHYVQLDDDRRNIEKLKKQLDELDPGEQNRKKIQRLREQLEELNSEERKQYLERDKNSTLNQEIQKHSLNIKNRLLNTTIIYYPVYEYRAYFKTSSNSKRLIHLNYNPVRDRFSEINCDNCGKELGEIILCSSGHLICRECGDRCENCNDIICKKCSTFECPDCEKNVCKKCVLRCPVCGKIKCLSHFTKEAFDNRNICKDCAKTCAECGKRFNPQNIKKTKTGKEICEKCYHQSVKENILNSI